MPKHDVVLSKVHSAVVNEATVAMANLKISYPPGECYAFALCSDNDVTSVYPMAHTFRAWEELCRKNQGSMHYYKTRESFRNYYKWYPDEWWSVLPERFRFKETTALIYPNSYVDESSEVFVERKTKTVETIVAGLAAAREKVFSDPDAPAVFLCIKDAARYEREIMLSAARPYNTSAFFAELNELYAT